MKSPQRSGMEQDLDTSASMAAVPQDNNPETELSLSDAFFEREPISAESIQMLDIRLEMLTEVGKVMEPLFTTAHGSKELVDEAVERLFEIAAQTKEKLAAIDPELSEEIKSFFNDLQAKDSFMMQRILDGSISESENKQIIEEKAGIMAAALAEKLEANPNLSLYLNIRSLAIKLRENYEDLEYVLSEPEVTSNFLNHRGFDPSGLESVYTTPFSISYLMKPESCELNPESKLWTDVLGRNYGMHNIVRSETGDSSFKLHSNEDVIRHENIHALQRADQRHELASQAQTAFKPEVTLAHLKEFNRVLNEEVEGTSAIASQTDLVRLQDKVASMLESATAETVVDSFHREIAAELPKVFADQHFSVRGSYATASQWSFEYVTALQSLSTNVLFKEENPELAEKAGVFATEVQSLWQQAVQFHRQSYWIAEQIGVETLEKLKTAFYVVRPSGYATLESWLSSQCGEERYSDLKAAHQELVAADPAVSLAGEFFDRTIGPIKVLSAAELEAHVKIRSSFEESSPEVTSLNKQIKCNLLDPGTYASTLFKQLVKEHGSDTLEEAYQEHMTLFYEVAALYGVNDYLNGPPESMQVQFDYAVMEAGVRDNYKFLGEFAASLSPSRRAALESNLSEYIPFFLADDVYGSEESLKEEDLVQSFIWPYVQKAKFEQEVISALKG